MLPAETSAESTPEGIASDAAQLLGASPDRPLTVCFVCTGNTCRSPMAAAWLTDRGRNANIRAFSAGLYARTGEPISHAAAEALEAAGIRPAPDNRYDTHTARTVSEAMIAGSDRVIGLSGMHALELITRFPQYAGKIGAMTHDIPDPFGGDTDTYGACLEAIAACLGEMFHV